MDDFGVLTEKYGLKPQGKAAPMAAAKRASNYNRTTQTNSKFSSVPAWNSTFTNGSQFDDNTTSKAGGFDAFDDVFGGFQKPSKPTSNSSFDFDSIFNGSNNSTSPTPNYVDDDIFGGTPGLKTSDSFPSFSKRSDSVDDLLGGFGQSGGKYNSRSDIKAGEPKKSASYNDLIPGFGYGNNANHKNGENGGVNWAQQSTIHSYKPTSSTAADPFVVLESTSTTETTSPADFLDQLEQMTKPKNNSVTKPGTLRPPPKSTKVVKSDKVKSSDSSVIDELEDFVMGKVPNNAKNHTSSQARNVMEKNSAKTGKHKESEDVSRENQQEGDDLDMFFGRSFRSKSVPKSKPPASDSAEQVRNRGGPRVEQKAKSGASANGRRTSSGTNVFDDLSSMFGAVEEFPELQGETEERRRHVIERIQRTNDRVARALAEKKQRDQQSQQEQEERHRIAELMDGQIKQWAAGKEGNMRALLSSLQYILWPECGWEPVSLTDLITSSSVKKVYYKATLCVHPDKVQQKSANLQQKYIAEKVFDILKESWKKFSKEELS